MEGDFRSLLIRSLSAIFLSTPSGWRATTKEYRKIMGTLISIHALRVEGDTLGHQEAVFFAISIHALRVEGDSEQLCFGHLIDDFYPRPPGGGRPVNPFWVKR